MPRCQSRDALRDAKEAAHGERHMGGLSRERERESE